MNRVLFSSALVVAAVGFGAGCTSPSPAATAESSAQDTTVPAPTQVVDTAAGKVLADGQGLSLYTFDPDTATASNCNGSCARSWPPLLAPATADAGLPEAPFGEITRNEGTKQLTFAGRALYRYVGDHQQGDVKGDGLGGVWHLARPAAIVTEVVDTSAGKILADTTGLSLYTFDSDTATASTCNDTCARVWPPLLAPTDPKAGILVAPFSAITRNDGTKQVAFEGHPLYRFSSDHQQGDVTGDDLEGFHLARTAQ
jgi:predicted lipoprotein with Yx(FWY)xxD motif